MSLKLHAPRQGKSPNWTIRGSYLGVAVDRSARTSSRADALKILRTIKHQIERGAFARPGEKTFLDAAADYMAHTGNDRFLEPIVNSIGERPLREVDQDLIDQTAIKLYPSATPATRNRQVHTPISAVLHHAGVDLRLRRPKGWRGNRRVHWLTPDQAFRVFEAADKEDAEFGVFVRVLNYTGARLGEALSLTVDQVDLARQSVYCPTTKNGEPRNIHLPPVLVEALADLVKVDRAGQRLFRFIKCGRLYKLLKTVKTATGPDVAFVTFHTFRHTWATWMRQYAGADLQSLIGTGAWRDKASVERYVHVDTNAESRRADKLPVETTWKPLEKTTNPLEKQRA